METRPATPKDGFAPHATRTLRLFDDRTTPIAARASTMLFSRSSRLRRSPGTRVLRKRTFQLEMLEGRALMASLLSGPLAASMAPALIAPAAGSVALASIPAPSGLSVSIAVRINPAAVDADELLRGIRDLFATIDALVTAAEPTDALRQAVADALGRIADATGAPQARPVRDLTEAVTEVADSGAITQEQQTEIESSVATILSQSGLDTAIVIPADLAAATPAPDASRTGFDPARIAGPYAEALATYRETLGQSGLATPTLGADAGPSATVADPDSSGRLIGTLTDLLRTSQAAPAAKAAFVDAVAAAARELPARPDSQQVAQLRQTVQALTPTAFLERGPRTAVARQLQATILSAGLPPAVADDLTARTLDVAAAPGLDAPGFRALFETVLAILNGRLP